MKINRFFYIASLLVILLAFAKIAVQLNFWVMPLGFFVVGLGAALWNRVYALYLFLFLFPFISAAPGLTDCPYPFNYMALPLFLLAGMAVAGVMGKPEGPYRVDADFTPYYIFLLFLVISAVFVFLRWSNLTVGGVSIVGADTPVSPPAPDVTVSDRMVWNEQRLSFASIFPVVSLFIYFISPYVFFFLRGLGARRAVVFRLISMGFYVSTALAVIQKMMDRSLVSDRLGKEFKQFYGGSSDFNSFGFFAGVMFLWATYRIKEQKRDVFGYVTFLAGLTAGILSGSRTFYFFILAGVVNLVFPGGGKNRKKGYDKHRKTVTIALVVVVVLLVIVAGGTLTKRLSEGFDGDRDLLKKLDAVTNGRVRMTLFTLETMLHNPVTGIGTGNFTFYLAYKNYLHTKTTGERYLYDLTLNHYTLIFAENGLPAFLCFTFFLVYLFRGGTKKLLLGTILFSLLLNNFFWFPEAFLLFWVVAALNFRGVRRKRGTRYLSPKNIKMAAAPAVLLFVVVGLITFNDHHPKQWAKETGIRYDYGFWYPEKDDAGQEFRWTTGQAGLNIVLDAAGRSPRYKVICGAPLGHLDGKKQTVTIFWKGKPYKEKVFTENGEWTFHVETKPFDEGFLEIRVEPAFNLKKMDLGPEPRNLGVQFFSE